MERLLSTEELAEYLGLPIGTLYRWSYVKTGPKALSVGRHLRYRESDVTKWLEEQAKEQGHEENNLSRANGVRKPVGRPRLA